MTTTSPDQSEQQAPPLRHPWWIGASVYQVYLRSFRDLNGDGIGDLAGLREGLDAIAGLGCDAIWINPCYVSPQRDHGYDIADYTAVDPAYGTLADFDAMLEKAHGLGVRVLMDMVANHCSSEHPWFRAALTSATGSPERSRFIFRDGRGIDGELPPNDWESVFGGPAWTRVTEPDGSPGQWYLHAFDAGQPDFNWRNADVVEHFDDVLRFWFDRGVDGFRIDVAHGMFKAPDLPDWPAERGHNYAMWDQPEVHEVYRRWRQIADSYEDPKYFVGEIWVPSPQSLTAYLRPDELHQAFTFELLVQPWDAARMRAAIETGLAVSAHGQPPAWTLSNHDVHRATTRYGQDQLLDEPDPTDMIAAARRRGPADLELGERRACAAAALMLALPGTAYLYQGEELGLPEVLDLPDGARQDPIWLRTGGRELGRDGCRVPLPWSHTGSTFGFSTAENAVAWLPQPSWFSRYARARQLDDPASTLTTYRALLSNRAIFGYVQELTWLESRDSEVLAFTRGDGICVVNFGSTDFQIPETWHATTPVVSTTAARRDDIVPGQSAAWFSRTNTTPSLAIAGQ